MWHPSDGRVKKGGSGFVWREAEHLGESEEIWGLWSHPLKSVILNSVWNPKDMSTDEKNKNDMISWNIIPTGVNVVVMFNHLVHYYLPRCDLFHAINLRECIIYGTLTYSYCVETVTTFNFFLSLYVSFSYQCHQHTHAEDVTDRSPRLCAKTLKTSGNVFKKSQSSPCHLVFVTTFLWVPPEMLWRFHRRLAT